MDEIRPASAEVVDFYLSRMEECGQIADACQVPQFSKGLRQGLSALSLGDDAIRLIESVTRIQNFGDTDEVAASRKAVSRILKARGVRLPKGKRTSPGLKEMVDMLVPLFLYFGLPLASSERSDIVEALRMIAGEIGVPGDPRDRVRRLIRIGRRQQEDTRKLVLKAFVRGWAPPES
jgi:hypothetical protein